MRPIGRRERQSNGLHVVDGGYVGCPLLGKDIDLDHCFVCSELKEVCDDHGATVVRCSSPFRARPAGFQSANSYN
jgi:hypothetical protein